MNKEMCLKIRKPSLRYDYFLFFDTPEYLADQLFIKQMVRVWFDQEYAKEGSPFLAILCHVKKKDSAKFLAALDALKNKMILCGYKRLFKLLIDKDMTQRELSDQSGVSYLTLTKMRKGEGTINTVVWDKICRTLNCDVSDILEIVPYGS